MESARSRSWPPELPASATHVSQRECAGRSAIRLSIIIPVFNERDTLAEIIRRVRSAPGEKEILLVDDGSTDGTRELLAAMQNEPDLRVVFHPENRGKGAALKTGFLHVTGDIVIIQDADLEYDPAEYPRLIEPIMQNRAEVVYGSRFAGDADPNSGASPWHALANRCLTKLSNLFTGLRLTDMETCYKVFRKDVIQNLAPRLQQNRFGIEPELTARIANSGFRVIEVPIRYRARGARDGKKIGWRDGFQAIWCIVRYWKVK